MKNRKVKYLIILAKKLHLNDDRVTHKEQSKIINKIREILLALSNMKIKIAINENMDYILENQPKERITLKYSDTLNPDIFPWFLLSDLTRFTPFEIFNYYSKELVPNEQVYNRLILKKSLNLKLKKKRSNNKVEQIEPENSGFPYCYCKKDISDIMIGIIQF